MGVDTSGMSRRRTAVAIALAAVGLVAEIGLAAPASAAPSVEIRPATPSATTYTVRSGDSLYGIALKMKVKLSALLEANRMTLNSVIHPGMTVVVPSGGTVPAAPAPAATATYTVRSGDSLWGIATAARVRLDDLLRANKLGLTSLIYPGMVLTLPGVAAAPTSTTAAPTTAAPTTTTAPDIYVVVSGDWLAKIAGVLKVSLKELLSANGLRATSVIHPGDRLVVPAGGVLPSPASPTSTTVASNATPIDRVLAYALAQVGKPYKFFTAGPETFDCSGLTLAAFAQIGISLPHYSGAQLRYGAAVDWRTEQIRPGDLVFLESVPGSGIVSHVGIATSATTYVHAPRSGDVVKTGTFPTYRILAVRRLVP